MRLSEYTIMLSMRGMLCVVSAINTTSATRDTTAAVASMKPRTGLRIFPNIIRDVMTERVLGSV